MYRVSLSTKRGDSTRAIATGQSERDARARFDKEAARALARGKMERPRRPKPKGESMANTRVNFNCDPDVKQSAIDRLPKGVTLTDVLTAVLEQIADGRLNIKSRLSLERINPESKPDASSTS